MRQLGEEFGLHTLALEDALSSHQRPKIERYEGYFFIVAYEAQIGDDGSVALHELAMFVANQFVVTVRHGGPAMLDTVRDRLDRTPSALKRGGAEVGYAVLDEIIDGYFPVVEAFEDRIEHAEDTLLAGTVQSGSLAETFRIKRQILMFRRVVAPLRDVLGRVVHIDQAVLGEDLDAEFRDLYDHVLRVYDELDTQRDLLTGILEAHLSVVSNRLNEVVLKLSSWAAIVLVPTLIAGIYGMNFDHMPELHWRLGYPYALGGDGGHQRPAVVAVPPRRMGLGGRSAKRDLGDRLVAGAGRRQPRAHQPHRRDGDAAGRVQRHRLQAGRRRSEPRQRDVGEAAQRWAAIGSQPAGGAVQVTGEPQQRLAGADQRPDHARMPVGRRPRAQQLQREGVAEAAACRSASIRPSMSASATSPRKTTVMCRFSAGSQRTPGSGCDAPSSDSDRRSPGGSSTATNRRELRLPGCSPAAHRPGAAGRPACTRGRGGS